MPTPTRRRKPFPAANGQIFQLKIALRDTKLPVWRTVHVPGDVTLRQLHEVLQLTMGCDEEDQEDEEGRWLEIEPLGSGEAYRDMERITSTIEDDDLIELLEVALDGRGAFGRCKSVLASMRPMSRSGGTGTTAITVSGVRGRGWRPGGTGPARPRATLSRRKPHGHRFRDGSSPHEPRRPTAEVGYHESFDSADYSAL